MFIVPAFIAAMVFMLSKQFYQGLAIVFVAPFLTSSDQFQTVLVVAVVWSIAAQLANAFDGSA